MTRRGWIVVMVLGVLVSIVAPVGWVVTRPPRDIGTPVAEALAGATPGATAAGDPAAGRGAADRQAVGGSGSGLAVPVQDGSTSRPRIVPDRLELPSLGVRAAVQPVGADRNGDLQIPTDVAAVGWYRFGPRPGDPAGSTVLSGHVDSAEQGRGAFFRLRQLQPGDPVVVHDSSGRVWRYRVVAREEWPKDEVPLERIFGRTGAPRLTLVTCGGGFREDVRSYRDNIAVTAVPDAES
jgi:hypothetical protein